MRRHAHIYVIENNGTVKVGHSRRPQRRLKELRRGGSIAHVTSVLDEVERIERTAHRLLTLSGRHVHGEWFAASVKEAISAIERAKRIVSGDELPLDAVPKEPVELLNMRVSSVHLQVLDELRKQEQDLPSRSEMVRRLILRADEQLKKPDRREKK